MSAATAVVMVSGEWYDVEVHHKLNINVTERQELSMTVWLDCSSKISSEDEGNTNYEDGQQQFPCGGSGQALPVKRWLVSLFFVLHFSWRLKKSSDKLF